MKWALTNLSTFLLVGCVTLLTTPAFAQFGFSSSGGIPNSLHAGLGLLDYEPGVAVSSATDGTKPLFSQIYPTLALKGYYNVYEAWSVSPELNLPIIGKKTPEGKEKTSASSFSLRFCRPILFEGFNLHVGPGLTAYQIKGDGGTQVQSNGSSTSTFGIPGDSRTSVLEHLDIGAGYQIDDYRVELSVFVTQILSSQKRAYNPLLTVSKGVF